MEIIFVENQAEARARLRGEPIYSVLVKDFNDNVIGIYHYSGDYGIYYSQRQAIGYRRKEGKWPIVNNKIFYHKNWEKYVNRRKAK